MEYTKKQLLELGIFRHFNALCQIPHISGEEKALSDYLHHWAEGLGLKAQQDSHHNLLIQKPAAPGYENAPAVMLQAHIDMVGDQVTGGTFDFSHDPIPWITEGENITTGGRTTLGADDGAGVALAMAILEDQTLKHPALEVALTTMEEVDFSGADNFDMPFQAEYLINLDGSYENQIVCGSSGGMDCNVQLPLHRRPTVSGQAGICVKVAGMAGGHSGREINRGRDTAVNILGRLLLKLRSTLPYTVASLSSGTSYIALSREAEAELALAPQDVPAAQAIVDEMCETIRGEHPVTGETISITLTPCPAPELSVEPEPILTWLVLSPNGIVQNNEMFPTVVASSCNLGLVRMNAEPIELRYDIRSQPEKMGQYTYDRLALLAEMTGGSCTTTLQYPSWTLQPNSRLRDQAVETYRRHTGCEPEVLALHVGLEVSYFLRRKKNLDAISIGSTRWGNHGPAEGMSIPSLLRTLDYLCALLAELR